MSRRGFMCAGCWTTDRIKTIDRWPDEEELAIISDEERQGGGSAHNVGIDLRKLDPSLPVSTVGMLGHDQDGDFLLQKAMEQNIDVAQLKRTGHQATSYSDVMTVSGTGKRTFFHHTGSNDCLLPAHFDFTKDNSRFLHLGLLSVQAGMDANNESGGNGWSQVLQTAQQHSLSTSIEMVSVDPVRNRELVAPCLPYIDYLIVNDHEIGGLADTPTLHQNKTIVDNCVAAAETVLNAGKMRLVVVHYPEGAICLTRDGQRYLSDSYAVPKDRIKSTVGAGDAFAAGFLYAMHENWEIDEALKLAHAVAATSLLSFSAVGAIQSVQQCLTFAQSTTA